MSAALEETATPSHYLLEDTLEQVRATESVPEALDASNKKDDTANDTTTLSKNKNGTTETPAIIDEEETITNTQGEGAEDNMCSAGVVDATAAHEVHIVEDTVAESADLLEPIELTGNPIDTPPHLGTMEETVATLAPDSTSAEETQSPAYHSSAEAVPPTNSDVADEVTETSQPQPTLQPATDTPATDTPATDTPTTDIVAATEVLEPPAEPTGTLAQGDSADAMTGPVPVAEATPPPAEHTTDVPEDATPAVEKAPAEVGEQVTTAETPVAEEESAVPPMVPPTTEQSAETEQAPTEPANLPSEVPPAGEPHAELAVLEETQIPVEEVAGVEEATSMQEYDGTGGVEEAPTAPEDTPTSVEPPAFLEQVVAQEVLAVATEEVEFTAEGAPSQDTTESAPSEPPVPTVIEVSMSDADTPAQESASVEALASATETLTVEESVAPVVVEERTEPPEEEEEQFKGISITDPETVAPVVSLEEDENAKDAPVTEPVTAPEEEDHAGVPDVSVSAVVLVEPAFEPISEEATAVEETTLPEVSAVVDDIAHPEERALPAEVEEVSAVEQVVESLPTPQEELEALVVGSADVPAMLAVGVSISTGGSAEGELPAAVESNLSNIAASDVPVVVTEPEIAVTESTVPIALTDETTVTDGGDLATMEPATHEELADDNLTPEEIIPVGPPVKTFSAVVDELYPEEPTAGVHETPVVVAEWPADKIDEPTPVCTTIQDASVTEVVEAIETPTVVEGSTVVSPAEESMAADEAAIRVSEVISAAEDPVEVPLAEDGVFLTEQATPDVRQANEIPAEEVEIVVPEVPAESTIVEAPIATAIEVVMTEDAAIKAAVVEDDAGVEKTPAEVEVTIVSVDAVQDAPGHIGGKIEPVEPSQEHPKSPWTPSYSVTTQGSGVGDTEEEIADVEQLSPATPQVVLTPEACAEPAGELAVGDRPKSPSWVPSYSVSSQGTSPLPSPNTPTTELPEVVPPASIESDAEPVVESSPQAAVGTDSARRTLVEAEPLSVEKVVSPAEQVVELAAAAEALGEEPSIETDVGVAQTPADVIVSLGEAPAVDVPFITTEGVDVSETPEQPQAAWIPSYSVSSYGSSPFHAPQPTASNADVAEIEPLTTPALEVDVPHEESPALATDIDSAAVREPNGIPASQTAVADLPAIEPQPDLAFGSDAVPVVESVAEVPAPPEDASAEAPTLVIDTTTVADEVPQPQTPPLVSGEGERSKSPWTPSYSVTHQGNSPLASPARSAKELEEVEQLPSLVQKAPSIIVEESAGDAAVPAVTAETVNEHETEEPPARPWTPSYSVTTQGPGTDVNGDKESSAAVEKSANSSADTEKEVEAIPDAIVPNGNGHNLHSFPTSEEPKKVAAKPSLARLAPVDENEQFHINDSSPSAVEALASNPRARLESTTSSRFFPGGWFSSTTKLLEEGRTSLEIATGEFAKSPAESVTSPVLEVPANTPIDGNVDDKKRQKWCVIM